MAFGSKKIWFADAKVETTFEAMPPCRNMLDDPVLVAKIMRAEMPGGISEEAVGMTDLEQACTAFENVLCGLLEKTPRLTAKSLLAASRIAYSKDPDSLREAFSKKLVACVVFCRKKKKHTTSRISCNPAMKRIISMLDAADKFSSNTEAQEPSSSSGKQQQQNETKTTVEPPTQEPPQKEKQLASPSYDERPRKRLSRKMSTSSEQEVGLPLQEKETPQSILASYGMPSTSASVLDILSSQESIAPSPHYEWPRATSSS